MLKTVAMIIGVVVAAVAIALIAYDLFVFQPYASAIRAKLDALPAEERGPSPTLAAALRCVYPNYPYRLVDSVGHDIGVPRRSNLERISRVYLWSFLMSIHFSERDRLALYLHYLPMEGGLGVEFGAKEYFGKSPRDLSYQEALGLMAVAWQPSTYSPRQHPEAFHEKLGQLQQACNLH